MNRKDFDILVRVVKRADPLLRTMLSRLIADEIEEAGCSSFNRDKFLERCGVK